MIDELRPRTIVVRYEHEIDALDRVAGILRRQRVRAEAFTAVASQGVPSWKVRFGFSLIVQVRPSGETPPITACTDAVSARTARESQASGRLAL